MDNLSDKIDGFLQGLQDYADTGCTLEPMAVRTLCVMLQDFAAHARRLEQAQNPAASAEIDDIFRIATLLARKGVRVGMPGQHSDGAA